MESFIVSINAILPLVILAAIGFFMRWKKIVSENTFNELNKMGFRLFLPSLLFYNTYMSEPDIAGNAKIILYMVVCVLVSFAVLTVAVPFFVKKPERQGVMIQGIFRGNFVLLGIPIAIVICGEGNIGPAAIAAAIIVPMFNFLSVITLSTHSSIKKDMKQIVLGIVKNPFIVSSLLGLALMMMGVQLPQFVIGTVRDLSKVATPLAVIVLGGSLAIEQTVHNKTALICGCVGKLIVLPLIVVSIAIALGFRGTYLVTIMIAFASPTAINSFIMAQQMGGDGELAGEIVLCSTICSAFTMFMWIFSLSFMGFI